MDRSTNPAADEETLPNFLIIGMAKSGMSLLYAYLGQHPQVYTSPLRAPNFFGLGEQDSLSYDGPVRSFPLVASTLVQYRPLFAGAREAIARGEGSSVFNFTPRAAVRIRHYVPKARLLLILRQPAERAYAYYRLGRLHGRQHIARGGREWS